MKLKNRLLFLICLISLLLLLAGCNVNGNKPVTTSKVQIINIATATTGGEYYPLGNAMARLFNQKIPGIKVLAGATAGTPQNILLMQKKDAEVAFAQNGVAYYAYNGIDMFKDRPAKFLRGITNLYPTVMHIVVAADSKINSIKEFTGKKFVVGAIGSATEINSHEILSLYGLDYKEKKNVKGEFLGYSEAAEALKDGRVDGILIAGGLQATAVLDAASAMKIRILSLEPDMIAKLKKSMPWYYEITIPKGTYVGQTEDIKTIALANLLVCREELSNELVYNMTKTLHDNHKALVTAHAAAQDMKIEDALKGITVPMHPGAEKYYKEKGIMK